MLMVYGMLTSAVVVSMRLSLIRLDVPLAAGSPSTAGRDQVHPLESTVGFAAALKLMLLPQPDEMAFQVAMLLIMGRGWTVTLTT